MLLAVAVTTLLTGCEDRSRSPDGKSDAPQTSAKKAFKGRTLPIQAYILTRDQEGVVHRAMQRLVKPCMEAEGFDIGLSDRLEPSPDDHQPDFLDRRYDAVYDEATARKYGYHLPFQVEHPTLPPNDPRYTAEVNEALGGKESERNASDQVDVAAGRTSHGGCMGRAEAELGKGMNYASPGIFWAQPVRLLGLDNGFEENPRIAPAQTAWSACMAEHGYQISHTTHDETPEPHFDLTTPLPSKAEVDMAVWDVMCQQRTGVVQTMFEAESEYELKRIDEQAEVFAQIKRENEQLVEHAASVLGEDVP